MRFIGKSPDIVPELRLLAAYHRVVGQQFEEIMQTKKIGFRLWLTEIEKRIFVNGFNLLVCNI